MAAPPDDDIAPTRDALLRWYDGAARKLPWREARDPWATWVSEVMLQQTRVETVIPYYERFLLRFPTPAALAAAGEADVLALWSGLGYYRRARLLHAGARRVAEAHGGEIPRDHAALRALPGVGDYTAGAVGSIAFGLRVPLVDGNVERVLTRLHAVGGDPRAPAVRKRLWALAARYADHPRPGDVNQSLMELGATVCAPTSPRCLVCPVRSRCAAARAGEPERYPEKPPRAAPREERWHALVATRGERVWLVPSAMGRWEGMLIPPMQLAKGKAAVKWGAKVTGARAMGDVTHVLTHARMEIAVTAATLAQEPAEGRLVAPEELASLAVPKVTRRVLSRAGWPGR
ncbi:MAG: A/G-specific adenine glycosylase [Polyangiales bacterium]